MMKKKINNLQSHRPAPMRVVSESTGRIKLPCFDDSSLFVFQFQFEIVASGNGWDDEEKRKNVYIYVSELDTTSIHSFFY